MTHSFCLSRHRCVAWAAVLLCAVTGCGAKKADVTGTVTYRGKPLVWGTVVVIASDQMPYYGVIQQDGTFTVKKVPIGPARLGVNSADPYKEPKLKPEEQARLDELRQRGGVELPPKPPKGKWFPIPNKYGNPATSGLTEEVKPPATTIEIKLD